MGLLVVTGGSRGIKATCARLGAQVTLSVCIGHRSSGRPAGAVVQDVAQAGGRVLAVRSDVSSERGVIDLFDKAQGAFGQVTGLVYSAGVLAPASRLADIELDNWNATIATNLTGTLLCAREAVRRMAKSAGGTGGAIVNVPSMAAVLGASGEFINSAAFKGAVDVLALLWQIIGRHRFVAVRAS